MTTLTKQIIDKENDLRIRLVRLGRKVLEPTSNSTTDWWKYNNLCHLETLLEEAEQSIN